MVGNLFPRYLLAWKHSYTLQIDYKWYEFLNFRFVWKLQKAALYRSKVSPHGSVWFGWDWISRYIQASNVWILYSSHISHHVWTNWNIIIIAIIPADSIMQNRINFLQSWICSTLKWCECDATNITRMHVFVYTISFHLFVHPASCEQL